MGYDLQPMQIFEQGRENPANLCLAIWDSAMENESLLQARMTFYKLRDKYVWGHIVPAKPEYGPHFAGN